MKAGEREFLHLEQASGVGPPATSAEVNWGSGVGFAHAGA